MRISKNHCILVAKVLLLIVFLFNIGIFGGIYEFLTEKNDKQDSEAHEALRRVVSAKIWGAEKKFKAKEFYREEEYFSDTADVFRKMMELGLKPGIPSGLSLLRNLYHGNRVVRGKHSEFARIMYKSENEDILEYFESSEHLVKKEDLVHLPSCLWTMYLKNLFLAFVLLLLEFHTNKLGFRNPFSFILLLVFYPVALGFIFYKWLRMTARSYFAEAEYRRTKKKLFTFLSQNEIAQIKKFARSNISFSCWRKELIFQHSFLLAMVATVVIAVVPKPVQAEKSFTDFPLGDAVQVSQHLARMAIENDKCDGDGSYPDFAFKSLMCNARDFFTEPAVRFINHFTEPLLKEVLLEIDHIPVNSDVFKLMARV